MAEKNLPTPGASVDSWGDELNEFLTVSLKPSGEDGGKLQPDTVDTDAIQDGVITDDHVNSANKDGADGTACMRTLGTGAGQASPGDHHISSLTHSGDLLVTGTLQVNGATTTINSTTLDVDDANITVNKGGDQTSADAQDAGITVEMSDATDVQIGFDSTAASKFIAGELGSESEIVTLDHTQTLTNKVLTIPRINSPKLNEDVSISTTATEVNQALDGIGPSVTAATLTAITSGGDAAGSHTHSLTGGATDVTATASELNQLSSVTVGGSGAGDIVTIDATQILNNKILGDVTLGVNTEIVSGGFIGSTVNTTNLKILTEGSENADSLHTHAVSGIGGLTATPDEINQVCDGVSVNVDATNLNTLTGGASGVADSLHSHSVATSGDDGFMSSDDKIKLDSGAVFESGISMVFYEASAPTGWTQVATHNDKALRVVSGTGGGSDGTHDLSTPPSASHGHSDSFSVSSGSISEAQLASHYHATGKGSIGASSGTIFRAANTNIGVNNTDSKGSGSVHGHGFTGSVTSGGPTAFAPKYVDIIICTKN